MRSFRRLALLLAPFVMILGMPATPALRAQSTTAAQSSSSSSQAPAQAPAQDQAQPPATGSEQQPATASQQPTAQQNSVQARIRARRDQRRAAAIHDSYSHLYETYGDLGYLRFKPGPSLQRLTFYGWDIGLTRYYNERFGVTVGGRGYTGIAYVGLNPYSQGAFTRPKVSVYNAMAGPTYRFYLQPRYSLSGRVMGGFAHGNFSGDTNGVTPQLLGLYSDSNTYAISGSIIGEANLTPNVAFRLAGDYFGTGFGSSMQNSVGFTTGIVYRFGKQ